MESKKLPIFNLYVDDSGTRHPDHQDPTSTVGDWFALGGILIKEEDESTARDLHADFCKKWHIEYPLHSIKIRHKSGNFQWLQHVDKATSDKFYKDLNGLIKNLPAICHACVIDRAGYRSRFDYYGADRWRLCKSAFAILMERASKFSGLNDRRTRVFVEETDRKSDQAIRGYFRDLRTKGMPFNRENSGGYNPSEAHEFSFRLLDLKFKRKSSPMMQIADLLLYPICRGCYDPEYRPTKALKDFKMIIDQNIEKSLISSLGVKRYCFPKNEKGPDGTLPPASDTETS